MKISIFGLGYVGAVSLACLARDGHHVIGVDVDQAKLDLIAAGKTPVVEEGMVELMADSRRQRPGVGHPRCACRPSLDTELSLICVGTPSAPNGSQDQSAMLRLAQDLGAALRDKASRTCSCSARRWCPAPSRTCCARSSKPSRARRTASISTSASSRSSCARARRSATTTSRRSRSSARTRPSRSRRLRALFGHLPCEFLETSIRAAEMVKYCCNNFHALKITFANETARLCEALGVDPFEVMDLVCQDRQLNISPAYLKPGFAFGGSCLPKDLRATMHLAKTRDVELPMQAAILPSNRAHIDHAIAKVVSDGKRRIGMIGLSFKTGTDDLRESPLVLLAEHFIGKGLRPSWSTTRRCICRNLLGANRRFIEQHLPHIGSLMRSDIARGDRRVRRAGRRPRRARTSSPRCASTPAPDQIVVDLVAIAGRERMRGAYEGLCW